MTLGGPRRETPQPARSRPGQGLAHRGAARRRKDSNFTAAPYDYCRGVSGAACAHVVRGHIAIACAHARRYACLTAHYTKWLCPFSPQEVAAVHSDGALAQRAARGRAEVGRAGPVHRRCCCEVLRGLRCLLQALVNRETQRRNNRPRRGRPSRAKPGGSHEGRVAGGAARNYRQPATQLRSLRLPRRVRAGRPDLH